MDLLARGTVIGALFDPMHAVLIILCSGFTLAILSIYGNRIWTYLKERLSDLFI